MPARPSGAEPHLELPGFHPASCCRSLQKPCATMAWLIALRCTGLLPGSESAGPGKYISQDHHFPDEFWQQGQTVFLVSKWLSARQEKVSAPGHKEKCVLEGGTGQERWLHCLLAVMREC